MPASPPDLRGQTLMEVFDTERHRPEILARHKAGEKPRAIANALGCSERLVHKVVKEAGLQRPRGRPDAPLSMIRDACPNLTTAEAKAAISVILGLRASANGEETPDGEPASTVREWAAWLSDPDRPRPDPGWADDAEAGYQALNVERVPESPWDAPEPEPEA